MSRSPLVGAVELRDLLGSVTLLDVRYRMGGPSGREQYAAGHVPGAAYVDLDTDLAAPPGGGGRHPLPSTGAFEASMRAAGVSGDRPVVVYDDWSGQAAARAWWLLRFHGHRDVRVLDGGWSVWLAERGAVETETPSPGTGDFVPHPGQMLLVEADGVLDVPVLIDARAAVRYRGESEPVDPVAGHIPGAMNLPTSNNLDQSGRFRSSDELRAIYAEVGATASAEVAAYCGSGVTATHDILAMEVAGVRAALYPGSWSGWITDPARPIERG